MSNPVLQQMEVLSEELNNPGLPPPHLREQRSPAEAMILDSENEVSEADDDIPPMPASFRQPSSRPAEGPVAYAPEHAAEAAPQSQPKRRFGFLGRKEKKPEPRMEPATAQTPRSSSAAQSPRATAQVMGRQAQGEAARMQQPAHDNLAEDLFPEHKKDDQFEIPAFLRRQSN
jgi:cell division protein FtsZ